MTDKSEAVPADFSVDLTILVGQGVADDIRSEPHLRSSRFIVFPDGRFHYGVDPKRTAAWQPPPVRTLDSQTMQNLWRDVLALGLADPALSREPENFKTVVAESGQIVYLLALTGESERWAVVHRTRADSPPPQMVQFVNRLAELAWVESYTEALRPLPARYDFGPDPYERFR